MSDLGVAGLLVLAALSALPASAQTGGAMPVNAMSVRATETLDKSLVEAAFANWRNGTDSLCCTRCWGDGKVACAGVVVTRWEPHGKQAYQWLPEEGMRTTEELNRSVQRSWCGEQRSREGGDAERAIAEEYEKYARIVAARWPRTASMLRSLGATYRQDAKREDLESEGFQES